MEQRITESGAQLFQRARAKSKPSLANLSPEVIPQLGPNQKDIIEITGDLNVGKTIQLMELIALAIIPTAYGGKGAECIVIDNNSNFHVPNALARIIEKHLLHHNIKSSGTTDTEVLREATDHIQETVFRALDRIHLMKCYTFGDFELALLRIPLMLAENVNISLIAIDSITAFYWTERRLIRIDNYVRQILKELKQINDEHRTAAIYTKLLHSSEANGYNRELIQYKIHVKRLNDTFEAITSYKNNTYRRRYTINTFGIDWLGSN